MEDVPASDGVAGHHGDNGLGHAPDEPLELEHVQPGDPVGAYVSRIPTDRLVPPGAERVLAVPRRSVPGEEHHAHLGIVPGVLEGFQQLEDRLGPEGVPDLRPVEGDPGDPVGLVIGDVLELPDLAPGHVRGLHELDSV